jgi:hypothetical protein
MEERINKALSYAWSYGQIDSAPYKMWVIDQMVKALCGDDEAYKEWVKEYETSMGLNECYEWDTGIAP